MSVTIRMIELQKKSPRDWITKPLKRVCEISTGMTPSTSNDQYFANGTTLWVKPNDLNEFSPIENTDQKLTPLGVSVSRKISGGSVLICGIGSIGKFGFSPREVTTNQQIHGISFFKHEIDERFGLYLCSSMSEVFQENSETVVVSILTKGKLERLKVSYPPLQKQQLISQYLDKKTSQIDSLVEKIQKKIDLLKEQRTSLINHYVTKGLDPNAEMKDSGVEWIGEIPSHWDFRKLKHFYSYRKGSMGQKLTSSFIDENSGEYPVYSGQTSNDGILGTWNEFEFDFDTDVIFCTTVGAKLMTTRVLSGKFSLSQNCLIMIPKDNSISSRFVNYFLTYDFKIRRELLPSILQPSLRMEDLDQYWIPVPPFEEQIKIIDYVSKYWVSFEEMISKLVYKTTLLKEYRQSIISSVVTGKVRVTEDMI